MTAQSIGLRTASLTMSAGLMALATLAALTMSVAVHTGPFSSVEPAPIDIVSPPPIEPPPPPPRPAAPPPVQPVAAQPSAFDASAALPPDLATLSGAATPATAEAIPIVDAPHWLRRPQNLARYYPARALARGVEGESVLDCMVSTLGRLRCQVVSETPSNWGFGAAALRIAGEHQMAPARRDGVAVEARYRMRVPFALN